VTLTVLASGAIVTDAHVDAVAVEYGYGA
jgi:hypothetical protein